ncbi:zf-CCHC domain-containing protein [Cucumis melo var. makuwa]|uniref:Zf-CCHC domain-containing protein n=1 Tax=Cucumis melo var. makuwa TaxID=1194695 RepID=A0A5A7UE06_CUCMM|nr:zf-CCHC domain-containing protein [Cucumis melo var. makuwa]TYK15028.1 zf-CCHC domain-containing protein [Cucumis melo var. makuwa]
MRPMENPLRYADDDSMEEYDAWQNEQECDSSSGDEHGNTWNENGDIRMRQVYRGHEARREVHHDYKMKIGLPTYNETIEEMMAARLKNINRKNIWETNLSKKQSYTNNANKQPSTSIAEKGKDVEAPEATKKKENAVKGRAPNNYNRPSLGKCFRCGQTGHLSNTCPQRKTIALADEEYDSASDGSKTVEEETELIEADDGERISCVIRSPNCP